MAKILIVEDEDDIRELMKIILKDHDTTCAQNGQIASDILKDQTFDLIMTDLRMPMMGGREFIWNFRKQDKKTPIIVMSGFVTDLSDCQTLGIQGSLMKPAKGDQITSLVTSVLEHSSTKAS